MKGENKLNRNITRRRQEGHTHTLSFKPKAVDVNLQGCKTKNWHLSTMYGT
jgi:hypothetical protein